MDTKPERSVGELFASASRDASVLVRSEIELAKVELKEDMQRAAGGAGMFAGAAFLGVVAFLLISFAAVYGIHALGLALGWSFLIVAGAYLLIAGLLMLVGRYQLKNIKPPERAIRKAKETVETLKSRGSS